MTLEQGIIGAWLAYGMGSVLWSTARDRSVSSGQAAFQILLGAGMQCGVVWLLHRGGFW